MRRYCDTSIGLLLSWKYWAVWFLGYIGWSHRWWRMPWWMAPYYALGITSIPRIARSMMTFPVWAPIFLQSEATSERSTQLSVFGFTSVKPFVRECVIMVIVIGLGDTVLLRMSGDPRWAGKSELSVHHRFVQASRDFRTCLSIRCGGCIPRGLRARVLSFLALWAYVYLLCFEDCSQLPYAFYAGSTQICECMFDDLIDRARYGEEGRADDFVSSARFYPLSLFQEGWINHNLPAWSHRPYRRLERLLEESSRFRETRLFFVHLMCS